MLNYLWQSVGAHFRYISVLRIFVIATTYLIFGCEKEHISASTIAKNIPKGYFKNIIRDLLGRF